jgi:hypothetical protein
MAVNPGSATGKWLVVCEDRAGFFSNHQQFLFE